MSILKDILSARYFTGKGSLKNWNFVLFVAALSIVMISSSHMVDKELQQISKLTNESKYYQDLFIRTRTNLMEITNQPKVVRKANEEGLELPKTPPLIITVKDNK